MKTPQTKQNTNIQTKPRQLSNNPASKKPNKLKP